jgi:hypothetical protein
VTSIRVFAGTGVFGPGKIGAWHSDDTKHSDGAAVVSAVVDPDLDVVAADLAAVEAALAELEEGTLPDEDLAGPDPA